MSGYVTADELRRQVDRLVQRLNAVERGNTQFRGRRSIDTGAPVGRKDYIRKQDLEAEVRTLEVRIAKAQAAAAAGLSGGGGTGGPPPPPPPPPPPGCPPNHPIDLGYWLVDGRYGDYYSEVKSYTNLGVHWAGDRQYVDNSSTPPGEMLQRLKVAMERSFTDGKKIYLIVDADEAFYDIEALLDILASVPSSPSGNTRPLWDAVKYVDIADEPNANWENNPDLMTNAIQSFAAGISTRLGPNAPLSALFGVTLSIAQTTETQLPHASLVQFVGVEMYALPDEYGGNINDIEPYLASLYANLQQAVPVNKKLFPIMQAYDRNGVFHPSSFPEGVPHMVEIQQVTYTLVKDDPRVLGISMFNYGRPNPGAGGGTKFYPNLVDAHKGISACIFTGLPTAAASKLALASGAKGSMAFSDG